MKRILKKLFRGLWYFVWYSFAASLVLIAAAFGLVRLLLPLIDDYNQDIEKYAESYAGRPIKIKSLDAEWHGFNPSLVLNNVRLLSKDGQQTLLHVSRARLDFNLYEMIKTKQVQFSRFGLSGANLSLVRLATGGFALAGFESNSIEPSQDSNEGAAITWLLSQGEISLHARHFIFRDQKNNNRRYLFSNLNLKLRNAGDRHMIDGSVGFAERSKQEFSFALDIKGNIRLAGGWSGSVYVSGENLNVNNIFGPIEFKGSKLQVGESDFEIWSDWHKASLTGLQGNVSFNDTMLQSSGLSQLVDVEKQSPEKNKTPKKNKSGELNSVRYQNLAGRFIWNKYDNGWQVEVDKLVLSNNQKTWPPSQLTIHQVEDDKSRQNLSLQAGFLRLEDIAPLLPVFFGNDDVYTQWYRRLNPSGDIDSVNFEWSDSDNNFGLTAGIKRTTFQAYEKFPGIDGVSGVLRMHKDAGSFIFDTRDAIVSLPKVFRSNISLNRFSGTVSWESNDNGISVTSRDLHIDNDHIHAKSILDLDLPASGESPFISVISKFSNGNVGKASIYYPYSIMSKGALDWLDTAFVEGNIVSGGAIVYGAINEFPFTKGQGVFDVRLEASNVTLDYAKDWPRIRNADTNVVFKSNRLTVNSKHARLLDSEVTDLSASIADLGAKVMKLDLKGKVTGETQDKLRYVLTAPQLKEKYERGLSDLRAAGGSQLDLDLTLSIGKEVDADVKGKLLIDNNTLDLVQIPGLLDSISGEVSFNNSIFKGKDIKANLLKQPVTVSVRTKKLSGSGNVVEYRAVGNFKAKEIMKSRFPLFFDMVDGDAPWTVRLLLPEKKDDPQLVVESNLKGVSLNLPVPFKKDKQDSRKLIVRTSFRNASEALMKISYAGKFEGILEKNYTKDMWLTRGEVRFGGGPAVLPANPGLRIVGDVEYLSYDVWENLIQQLVEIHNKDNQQPAASNTRPTSNNEPDPYFQLVNSVDLNARIFEIFGQKDTNARIRMDNKQTWLAVNIESDNFNGNVKVPDDLDTKPIELDMSQFNIKPLEDSGGKIDPREIPSIKFNSRSVNYGDKKLGQVAVETSKQANGLLVQQLIVKPRATVIKGHGAWVIDQDGEKADLELVVESEDLGKTMKDLGYVGTIADGKGTLTAQLEWPASLVDPDLYHIGGKVRFNLENGRILDIEPGSAARLFGLFSLQTLPRRLTLDFSDLFSKGLKFDIIKGDFNIENGDAYTSNLELIGPNANVLLRGRIGIGAQDYDQKVRVTPHITDTTILLSIITSQPLLFLFQQLLKQDIDAATSFEYTLSGKWNNYKLTPISKVPPAPAQQDDF